MLVSDCVLFGITVFIRAFGFVNGMCHAGFVSFAIGRIKCFHCNQECGHYWRARSMVILLVLSFWFHCVQDLSVIFVNGLFSLCEHV